MGFGGYDGPEGQPLLGDGKPSSYKTFANTKSIADRRAEKEAEQRDSRASDGQGNTRGQGNDGR
jgi:hypothetical protein